MLNFKRMAPFTNRVLVKRVEPLAKSKGGIILTDSSKQELNYGQVVAVGPGLTLNNGTFRENAVRVGQNVLLPGYSGAKIKLADEQEYYVYRDDDIIGILEEPVTTV
jgi:chaperonin GroES